MPADTTQNRVGSLKYTDAERKELAKRSLGWQCPGVHRKSSCAVDIKPSSNQLIDIACVLYAVCACCLADLDLDPSHGAAPAPPPTEVGGDAEEQIGSGKTKVTQSELCSTARNAAPPAQSPAPGTAPASSPVQLGATVAAEAVAAVDTGVGTGFQDSGSASKLHAEKTSSPAAAEPTSQTGSTEQAAGTRAVAQQTARAAQTDWSLYLIYGK